jgi:NADH-quinone oxidoreductase subunit H
MTTLDIVATLVKILVMVGFLFNVAGLLTWVDRRLSSMIQDRIGPNRAALPLGKKIRLRILGLLHTAADGVKFFTKEDFMPPKADKLLFSMAPIMAMASVLVLAAVIPMGDTVSIAQVGYRKLCVDADGRALGIFVDDKCLDGAKNVVTTYASTITQWPAASRLGVNSSGGVLDLTIAPINVGILYIFAMAGQGIVGAAIAGWSSDNKFSLMGALRAASQMVSYEVTLGLSLVGAMMIYGSVRLQDMVLWQGENTWGIFVQPLAFFLFFAAAVAESKRIPFDLPEAESELVSGYFTEYSGMKFGMFYFAEYMEIVTSSMLLVTIFLGGWQLPWLHRDGLTIAIGDTVIAQQKIGHLAMIVIGVLAFFGKTLIMCLFQAFVRWSLPRFRYDQLQKLCWKTLLPLSLANIFATGIIWLGVQNGGASLASGLKVAADITQGVVAVLITAAVIWAIVGFFSPTSHAKQILGTAARRAAKRGGTVTEPMQA